MLTVTVRATGPQEVSKWGIFFVGPSLHRARNMSLRYQAAHVIVESHRDAMSTRLRQIALEVHDQEVLPSVHLRARASNSVRRRVPHTS